MFKNFIYKLIGTITLILFTPLTFADIPAAPDIPGGSSTDPFKMGQGVFNEGSTMTISIIFVVSILVYCGALIMSYLHGRKHKEWGLLGTTAIVGLGVNILILYFLNKAKATIGV
jgi:hypothetical protein